MDVQRQGVAAKKRKKQIFIGIGVVTLLILISVAVSSIQPAAPSVRRDAIWIGEVRQGPLQVRVRGIGNFVPEDQRWLTAQTAGIVEERTLLPGARVEPDSVILVLSNPELEQQLRNARLQLSSAEASLANQRVREEDTLLEMEFQLAQLTANYENAQLDVRVNEELYADGLIAERELLRSRVALEQLQRQSAILQQRLDTRSSQMEQNLAPAIAAVEQERERLSLVARQVDQLTVRAGIHGVLQRLNVQDGQQVAPGTQLAQVSDPARLKAVVRIPETQAKDVVLGQAATVDNRNGTVIGQVARIDPAVEGGQVNVDIRLENDLPPGSRSDQTVEAQIELENLDNVIYVGRPSFGREFSTANIFVISPNGNEAFRRRITFGRSSVSEIEIRDGLQPGERVILSDTSQWEGSERVRIN